MPENPKVLINYVSSLKCLFSLMSGTRFTEWNMFAANSAAAEHTAEPSAALFSILKDHRGYALWIWVVSEGLWAGHGWTQQQRLMIGGEEEMAAFCCRDSKAKWSRKKKKTQGEGGGGGGQVHVSSCKKPEGIINRATVSPATLSL